MQIKEQVVPALASLREKYDIGKVVFVADSAMLSIANISELESLTGDGVSFHSGSKA